MKNELQAKSKEIRTTVYCEIMEEEEEYDYLDDALSDYDRDREFCYMMEEMEEERTYDTIIIDNVYTLKEKERGDE